MKVKIICGENKNKTGTVKSILWGANLAIIELDGGEELAVNPMNILVAEE